jgi:hypothetical protein
LFLTTLPNSMNYSWMSIVVLTVFSYTPATLAQTTFSQPDAHGDYYTNVAPIQGTLPEGSKLQRGSLWQVVSSELNCHRRPHIESAPVRQFKRGDVLQAEVGRGGADEVLINARATDGKPWMWVRAENFRLNDACYVRANRRYIKPYEN